MDADNKIKVVMVLKKEHVYIKVNGIYCYHEIDEDAYKHLKEAFTPMIEELQKYVIMANIGKRIGGTITAFSFFLFLERSFKIVQNEFFDERLNEKRIKVHD